MKQTRVLAKTVLRRPDGKVLILRRSKTDTRRPLQWDLPGGTLEPGEDYVAAAVRETLEEAGITVTTDDLQLAYTMSDMTDMGNACWLFFIGDCGDEEVRLSYEHDKFYWATETEAREMVTYDRQHQALKHIFDHALFD